MEDHLSQPFGFNTKCAFENLELSIITYFNDKSFSPQQFHIVVNDHFGPVPRVKTLSLDLGNEFVNDPEQMVKLFTNNIVKSADEFFLILGN